MSDLQHRLLHIWHTSKDWNALTKWQATPYCLLSVSVWVTWTLVIIEVARVDINRDNFTQVLGTVSVWFGGTLTSMRIVENYRHRDAMSDILTEINEKVKRSRLVASKERNEESKKLSSSLGH